MPLRDVVTVRPGTGPSVINRLNRQRLVAINSNVAPGFGESDILLALEQFVKDQHMPVSYHGLAAGPLPRDRPRRPNFLLAFVLSFVFMYLVLAAQFESWLHPITILWRCR